MSGSDYFEVFIPGRPMPQPRPRVTKFGVYEPKRVTDQKKLVLKQYVEVIGGTPVTYDGPVWVEGLFVFPRSISKLSKKHGDHASYRLSTPDCDNLMKLPMDALNGYAWPDDSQVQLGSVAKFDNGVYSGINPESGRQKRTPLPGFTLLCIYYGEESWLTQSLLTKRSSNFLDQLILQRSLPLVRRAGGSQTEIFG